MSDIFRAIDSGDLQGVRSLLRSGGDPNTVNDDGRSALMHACRKGRPAVAQALLDAGAAIDSQSPVGETVILNAAWSGNQEVLEKVLAHSPGNGGVTTAWGLSPLGIALQRRDRTTITALLDAGIPLVACAASEYALLVAWEALSDAERDRLVAACTDLEWIRAILLRVACGLRVSQVSMQPELFAAAEPVDAWIENLLDEGADANLVGAHGPSALCLAAACSDRWPARRLLEVGANPNLAGADGNRALLIAARSRQTQMASLLIEFGADPNVAVVGRTPARTTPLVAAIDDSPVARVHRDAVGNAEGIAETVNMLLAAGADPNQASGLMYPLFAAASIGATDAMHLLLDYGADPELRRADGLNALISACGGVLPYHGTFFDRDLVGKACCRSDFVPTSLSRLCPVGGPGSAEAVDLLLDLGADPNAKLTNGWAPIMGAVWGGDRRMYERLIGAGADPNAVVGEGLRPLMIAVLGDSSEELIQSLIAHGADPASQTTDGRTALAIAQSFARSVIAARGHHRYDESLANARLKRLQNVENLLAGC
jgi:uncharacterized protein